MFTHSLWSWLDIFVPPEQVIDTVDLYFLPTRQRRLSLRFLSWFVLHEHIQTDTHDSIEDARSALRLYKAFQDFEDRGVFDGKLEQLYREGKQYVGFLFLSVRLIQNADWPFRTGNRRRKPHDQLRPARPLWLRRPHLSHSSR
jgi:hypothetical protein